LGTYRAGDFALPYQRRICELMRLRRYQKCLIRGTAAWTILFGWVSLVTCFFLGYNGRLVYIKPVGFYTLLASGDSGTGMVNQWVRGRICDLHRWGGGETEQGEERDRLQRRLLSSGHIQCTGNASLTWRVFDHACLLYITCMTRRTPLLLVLTVFPRDPFAWILLPLGGHT